MAPPEPDGTDDEDRRRGGPDAAALGDPAPGPGHEPAALGARDVAAEHARDDRRRAHPRTQPFAHFLRNVRQLDDDFEFFRFLRVDVGRKPAGGLRFADRERVFQFHLANEFFFAERVDFDLAGLHEAARALAD